MALLRNRQDENLRVQLPGKFNLLHTRCTLALEWYHTDTHTQTQTN